MQSIFLATVLTCLFAALLPAQILVNSDPSTPMSQVSGIAVADFNHDGELDVATLASNGTFLLIQLGQGNGLFRPGFQEPATTGLGGILAADFNQDGKLDLVVYSLVKSQISIFLGNGDGTFQPESVITTQVVAENAAVAQFNADSAPDFVVVGGALVQPFLGNGNGTFTAGATVTLAPGASCLSIAIADFNNDGKQDLAVACGSLQILNGKGNGTFNSPNIISSPAQWVTAGDFNGDGHVDLATSATGEGLNVLLNSGNGTFGSPQSYGGYFGSMQTGDLNGDGILDIYGAFQQSGGVEIAFGNADGSFQQPVLSLNTSGEFTTVVAAADFTNDGIVDLVTANQDSICVLPGAGSGRFVQPASITLPGAGGVIGATLDLNGDGLDDLVYFSSNGKFGQYMEMNTAINAGGGIFTASSANILQDLYNPGVSKSVAVGDLNGDGKLDIVYGSESGYILAALSSSSGAFSKAKVVGKLPASGGVPYVMSAVVGDFSGDGKLDVAALFSVANQSNQNLYVALAIFPGNGDGTLSSPKITVLANTFNPTVGWLVAGDFNGDGKLDAATLTGEDFFVLLGKGDGTFSPSLKAASTATSLAAGDVNRDGLIDLVVTNVSESGNGTATLLLSKGDGTFTASNYPVGVGPANIALADLNGDQYPEVLVSNAYSSDLSILLNRQNATLQPVGSWYASPGSIFVGHFLSAVQPTILVNSSLLSVSE